MMRMKLPCICIAVVFGFIAVNSYAASGDVTVFGNMGIGTSPSTTYRLYVSGAAYATIVWQSSDASLKENVGPIASPLQKLRNVQGVSFTWKQEGNEHRGFPGGKHNGVVAQDVEKVFPEVVQDGPEGEKAVAYSELIPILIEAMKEQQNLIDLQQKDIQELKAALKKIKPSK
jgi:hypothetical protein